MSVAVIQGSSSGLGQAFARHLLRHTNLSVYALTRRRARDVEAAIGGSARLTVVDGVDVTAEAGLERAAGIVKERQGLNVRLLVCMAGILRPEKSLTAIDAAGALAQFQTNALGHLLTYKHFAPLIPTRRALAARAAAWGDADADADPARGVVGPTNSVCCSMSARVGSIADNERGGWYSYRASKAAVNQIVRTLDHELVNKSSSAVAVAYHPGTVLTPFTAPVIGSPAPDPARGVHTVDDAVGYMVGVLGRVRRDGDGDGAWGGRCFDWKGERVEW